MKIHVGTITAGKLPHGNADYSVKVAILQISVYDYVKTSRKEMGEMQKQVLLKKKEVAEIMRVSVQTVNRMTKRGELPFRRIGGQVMFLYSDIIKYIERGGCYETDGKI